MRNITALIFVFVLAPSLMGGVRPAFPLNGTNGEFRFVLCGLGGATLDTEETPPPAPQKPPEPPGPATPEKSKEHGMLPPAETLTPQPESRGLGAVPPSPAVVTPAEVPRREKVKKGTGSKKAITSKEPLKKHKERGKTTTEPTKTAKGIKSRSPKTTEKPAATSSAQKKAPAPRHPSSIDVTKSLGSGTGRRAPRPDIQKRTTPSSKKNVPGQPGTTQR